MNMSCQDFQQAIGAYLDGELPSEDVRRIEAHLHQCSDCLRATDELYKLTIAVARERAKVPSQLWVAIERKLDVEVSRVSRPITRPWAPRFRLAAVIAIIVGLGATFAFYQPGEGTANASTIDFRALLDPLPMNPRKALDRFLKLYHGKPISPEDARTFAPDLDFELPDTLPGGFKRQDVFSLRFDSKPGIAARYERSGELLVAIFHPTVHSEQFGTHRDYPCIVGRHHGHMVKVGDWRLIHVTDPVTCHCILSKLPDRDLAPVLKTVAPRSKSTEHTHD